MDDALLVCVLHGAADVHEQLEALPSCEPLRVAVFSNRRALDELHDEEGTAFRRRAPVMDFGDVGMVHHRQRLPLGFEASDDLPRVHAGLDDLQSHATTHRPLLLGDEHQSHAAFADLFQQLVRADDRAGAFHDQDRIGLIFLWRGGESLGVSHMCRRSFQEIASPEMVGDHPFDALLETRITRANLANELLTVRLRSDFHCLGQDGFDARLRCTHG